MTRRATFQFQLRELLYAMTAFAAMLFLGMLLWRHRDTLWQPVLWALAVLWLFGAFAAAGAAAGATVRAPIVGAAAGLACLGIVAYVIFFAWILAGIANLKLHEWVLSQ